MDKKLTPQMVLDEVWDGFNNTPHEMALIRSASYLLQIEAHMRSIAHPEYRDLNTWVLQYVFLDGMVLWASPTDPEDFARVLTVTEDDWRWN